MFNYGYAEEGQRSSLGDGRLWRRILKYSAPYSGALAAAVLLSLAVSAATLTLPRLMQQGIDLHILATHAPVAERIHGLSRMAFYYGLLVALIFLITFAQTVVLEWVGQSVMHQLRQDLFSHLLHLDLRFFHQQPAGRLVTRLTNDIQNMHEMFTSVMVTLFNEALKLAGIFFFLLVMNLRLALLMAIFAPLALAATIIFSGYAREKFSAIRAQLAKINAFLAETLGGGVTVIQIFAGQGRSSQAFQALNEEYLQRAFSQIRIFGAFMPLTELFSSAAIAVIIWYGGGEVIRSQLSIGQLTAFLAYMRLFFQPLRELSQNYSIVQSAMASAERIFESLDETAEIRTLPTPSNRPVTASQPPPSQTPWRIEFQGVDFGYTQEELVLRKINAQIRFGETVALVGATGAGKTSLLSLLLRFYDPLRGAIYIDGEDIRHLPLAALRRKVGVIMQDIFILPDTVEANILLDQPLDAQKLQRILDHSGLHPFIDRLPQGMQTKIGEGALNLSLGEKQLLSFVRALYRDPAILLLDEATASIDTESENLLEQALNAGLAERTSLVIAHRLSTVRRADRIWVMDQGRIVEQGSHQELMQRDSLYSNLARLDMRSV